MACDQRPEVNPVKIFKVAVGARSVGFSVKRMVIGKCVRSVYLDMVFYKDY